MEQIPPIIHESWHEHLQPLFNDRKMILLKNQVLPNCHFYPEAKNIFRVFSMPLDLIKVVIIGQDPYPNPNEAIGLAFAVSKTTRMPKSLEIIKSEILNSKVERDTRVHIDQASWREFTHWHQQGVFLLNSALTVEFKNAGSHLGYWQWFTKEVVSIISNTVNPVKPVWLLWGAKAQSFKDIINNPWNFTRPKSEIEAGYEIDRDSYKLYNVYITSDHPAAELYNGGTSKTKFSGSDMFNKCNKALKLKGQTIINW